MVVLVVRKSLRWLGNNNQVRVRYLSMLKLALLLVGVSLGSLSPCPTLTISRQVRDALKQEFPSHDVVEFFGVGSTVAQLELFATASVVVAPHGAGLSNILVSPRHTTVLEIAPPACTACYIHLALKVTGVCELPCPAPEQKVIFCSIGVVSALLCRCQRQPFCAFTRKDESSSKSALESFLCLCPP